MSRKYCRTLGITIALMLLLTTPITYGQQPVDEEFPFLMGGLSWSPEGTMLAVGTSQGIGLHDGDNLALIEQLHPELYVSALDWSANGVIFGDGDGILRIWYDNETRFLFAYSEQRIITSIRWSPPSDKIASSNYVQTIQVLDADTSAAVCTLNFDPLNLIFSVQLAWSPTDEYLAANLWLGRFEVWDVQTCELAHQVEVQGEISAISWHPTDNLIAVDVDSGIGLWSLESERIEQIFGTDRASNIHTIAWHPSGSYLALQRTRSLPGRLQGQIEIWDVAAEALVATIDQVILTGDVWYGNAIAWSPDGSKFASVSDDGRIRLWHGETFERLAIYDQYKSILLF